MSWLDPVVSRLDEAPAPVPFFFRDDDAGWEDAALLRLLDVFEQRSAPIDVAVIPAAMGGGLAEELACRAERRAVRVHQHGWAHLNHEVEGRKCEFGPARDRQQQMADIANGHRRLLEQLGWVEPVFTPPWNRCSTTTGTCLVELDFEVLSRDVSAPALEQPGLAEAPVSVDWFAERKGNRLSLTQVGQRIADRAAGGGPVGVMLHHTIATPQDVAAVDELLSVITDHRQARPVGLLSTVRR